MNVRGWAVAAVALLGGVGLSACSSGPNSSSPTTKATTTTTRGGGSGTGSTSTTAPSTTTTAFGPPQCATTSLSAGISGSSGAAGTIETTIALKSTAAQPCVLSGYPGLGLLASNGSSLPSNVVRKGSYSFTAMAPTTVTLTPGESAYFNVGYSDVPVGSETSCPTSASLEVTPPNSVVHLTFSAALAPCGGGTLVVSPVFLATSAGSQTTAPPAG
jgi:Protein of unknown function (DUF4232)